MLLHAQKVARRGVDCHAAAPRDGAVSEVEREQLIGDGDVQQALRFADDGR